MYTALLHNQRKRSRQRAGVACPAARVLAGDFVFTFELLAYMELRELFGGAITSVLPSRFVDSRLFTLTHTAQASSTYSVLSLTNAHSLFRQVPDAQEVFVDAATDQSLIIEILEREDSLASDAGAAEFRTHRLVLRFVRV